MQKQEHREIIDCIKSAIGLIDLTQNEQLRQDTITLLSSANAICNYLENSKLLQQGFQTSISDFQGFLYVPKLREKYQSELASALQRNQFVT